MPINVNEYQNILTASIAHKVQLIAVSKLQNNENIFALHKLGQIHFAENYVQEFIAKAQHLPKDICWHFIGHLQSNKVKDIIPFVTYIHSIDNIKLLQEVQKRSAISGKHISVLLQIKISKEENKFGFNEIDLEQLLLKFLQEPHLFANITIVGVMGMASFVADTNVLQNEFRYLKNTFESIRLKYFYNQNSFKEISMGMSNDYVIAMQAGSTMIRIGSSIFGKRQNKHIP